MPSTREIERDCQCGRRGGERQQGDLQGVTVYVRLVTQVLVWMTHHAGNWNRVNLPTVMSLLSNDLHISLRSVSEPLPFPRITQQHDPARLPPLASSDRSLMRCYLAVRTSPTAVARSRAQHHHASVAWFHCCAADSRGRCALCCGNGSKPRRCGVHGGVHF